MNYDEMKKDAESRSNFVKLERDVPTRIKFLSAEFKKVEKDFGKGPVIKYEVPCIVKGEEKLYQGSARFYSECMSRAETRGKQFTEVTYTVTKTGEGLSTKYITDIVEGVVDTAPADPTVPF